MNKENVKSVAKQLLELDPIFTNKFGPKLKKYIKWIYYIVSVLIVLNFLSAFISVFTGTHFSIVLLEMLFYAVDWVFIRMFAEYLNAAA